jgi:tetratricopeptide (TPR) repeat protein
MCTSTSLKTLRTNIPLLNNKQQVNDDKIISNDSNISLVWFDKNTCLKNDEDVRETKQMLQEIQANVTFHSDLDNFIKFIDTNSQETFFLIISGAEIANTVIFQRIHALKQIDSIFIFCLEKQTYEPLLTHEQHSKIIGIFNTQFELCFNIRKTLDHVRRQLAVFTLFNQKQQSMRNLTNDSIRFLWYQLLKDNLWRMPRTDDWKIRMIENCRDYYRRNIHELKHIEEFETQYQSIEAVKWYTKDTFVYKLINQALRTEDIDALYILRYYIEDLCINLKNKYERFRQIQIDLEMPDVTLYRGLRLDRNQLLKLKLNEGNLISTNSFLSASRSIDVAKLYAGWDINNQSTTDTTEPVLFIINMNVNEHKIIVADIVAESQMPDELEVLFDLGSIFKINSITEDDTQKPSKWTIIITASNDGDKVLNDYINFKREEMEEFDINILFGEFLYDMGEYQKAEKYFENLLSTEDTPQRRLGLGTVYALKGEYDRALYYLQSTHDQYHEILSSMISVSNDSFNIEESQNMLGQMARTLASIANIYFHTDNPDEALFNYTAALNLYKTVIMNDNIPHIGTCLQNIGLIYEKRGFYTDAMNNFQQANEIYSKTLPENHPDRAGLLLNIGNIYKLQVNDDLAIKSYTDALDIMKKIYPANHPSIAECMNNIGLVYMSNNRYEDALKWFFECLENYNQSDLSTKQKIYYANIYAYIAEIYEKKYNINDAIRYYDQSLIIYKTITKENLITIESDISCEKSEEKYSLTDLFSTLEELKEIYPNEHPHIVSCLHDIGKTFFNEKNYKDALQYYKQLLEIFDKLQHTNDLHTAECLKDISLIYQIEGDYSQALNYAIKSYDVLRKILSFKHPVIKNVLEHIIQLCNNCGESTEASFYSTKLRLSVEKETPSTDFDDDCIQHKIFYLNYKIGKYQEALNVVSSKPNEFEDEDSETILGQIYFKLGDFEQAIIHSKNALKLSSNDSNIARCYTQIGHAYISQHDNTNALIFYEKCLEILRHDIKDEDELANILVNIGAIYLEQNNLNESILHYSEALKIKRKTDPENINLINDINCCIAKSFFNQNNYDQALEHYLQSLEIFQKLENNINESTEIIYHQNQDSLENIYDNIAKIYYDKQDYKMALFYYKKSLTIADNNDSSNLTSLLFNISQTHFQMGNLNYGLDYLRQCIEVRETLVHDENDSELMVYKQTLAFSQLLFDANKRKRRKKYKRLFHKRYYQRRKKKKTLLRLPAKCLDLIAQFSE